MANEESSLFKRLFFERPIWIDNQELWYTYQVARFFIPLCFAWLGSRVMRDAPAPSLLLATLVAIVMFAVTFVIVCVLFKLITQTVEKFIS